jgi:hypothetical protein
VDAAASALIVIEPSGKLGRVFAPVNASDLGSLRVSGFGVPGFDAHGRLLYRTFPPRRHEPPPGVRFIGTLPAGPPATRDTMWIVRADFDRRAIDTLASVTIPHAPPPTTTTVFINPGLGALDDWALLSDGAVAVVRGQDYHIDWLYANGSRASTPKMAFDWRRLTDADKQAKVDSARRIIDSLAATGKRYGATYIQRFSDGGRMVTDTVFPAVDFVPLKDIADYIPPIRAGALKPDRDGNLWILPTTSAQASAGLLYDVVNQKG